MHVRQKQNKCGWVLPQKKQLLEYMPFSVVWCLLINGIGRLIGRCYLHDLCPLTSQHYKRRLFKHSSSGAAGKSPVHTTSDTQRQSDTIPFISMESWRFPATASDSDRWRPDGACPATRQSSESFNFMQIKSDFRERQPIGKKTVELTWSFSSQL